MHFSLYLRVDPITLAGTPITILSGGTSLITTDPAPTITGHGKDMRWAFTRPATTVQGDPRIAPPGHKDRAGGERQFGEGTVRCEPHELATLQGFRDGYPFQGSRTAQFRQIGDAVPPPMARAIVEALI